MPARELIPSVGCKCLFSLSTASKGRISGPNRCGELIKSSSMLGGQLLASEPHPFQQISLSSVFNQVISNSGPISMLPFGSSKYVPLTLVSNLFVGWWHWCLSFLSLNPQHLNSSTGARGKDTKDSASMQPASFLSSRATFLALYGG